MTKKFEKISAYDDFRILKKYIIYEYDDHLYQ